MKGASPTRPVGEAAQSSCRRSPTAEAAVSNTVQCGFESHPGHMVTWLVQRRLAQTSQRLTSLRAELRQIDEQLDFVADEADNQAIRALVSETPGASHEANDARKHADAMRKHRQHVVDNIRDLEARQDELLDKMNAAR